MVGQAVGRDLALVELATPPEGIGPVALGSIDSVSVGSEVYAIGHPKGLLWTFTEGVVSQIRRGYEWTGGTRHRFHATVIQTQTPINPGNSGGPLFNEDGQVVGINSFLEGDSEGLNFAVASDEIEAFLRDPAPYEPSSKDVRREPGDAQDLDGDGRPDAYGYRPGPGAQDDVWLYDLDGDGRADALGLDLNGNGRPDTIAYDTNGDGIPDLYRYDRDEDGRFDLEGVDKNGDGKIDRIRRL